MIEVERAVEVKKKFAKVFGSRPQPRVYRAPGRVNLIGEHTDYNGGLVFPVAIDLDTYVCLGKTGGSTGKLYSTNLDRVDTIDLEDLGSPRDLWTDYVQGLLLQLDRLNQNFGGFEILIDSDVPVGGGLSSSAALEVSVMSALIDVFDMDVDDHQIVNSCQRAENDFVGASTGIMDQYISYFGRSGSALLLNTSSLSYRTVDLNIGQHSLLVIDTRVSHTHGANEYNKRRSECEEALELLNEELYSGGLASLSGLKPESLSDVKDVLPEKLYNRVRHVVSENERVIDTADFMVVGETEKVGELFFQSHQSLKKDYEVSSPELDFLVDFAREYPVTGARMTGGGFGGSTIHLVPENALEDYANESLSAFEAEFGVEPRSYVVEASDGAKHKPFL